MEPAEAGDTWRHNGWGKGSHATCDMGCVEAGGTGRRDGWGMSDVAACELLCTDVVLGAEWSGVALMAWCLSR